MVRILFILTFISKIEFRLVYTLYNIKSTPKLKILYSLTAHRSETSLPLSDRMYLVVLLSVFGGFWYWMQEKWRRIYFSIGKPHIRHHNIILYNFIATISVGGFKIYRFRLLSSKWQIRLNCYKKTPWLSNVQMRFCINIII